MKTILALVLACATALADPQPTSPSGKVRVHNAAWSACDVSGSAVPVAQAVGDLATLSFPSRYAKVPLVSFLTTPVSTSLAGKTITATVRIDASAGAVYSVNSYGGWSIPPNMRIYFTTRAGAYSLNDADRNDTHYWWSDTAYLHLTEDVVNGLAVSMTATFTALLDPAEWSDANGHPATESAFYTAAFEDAAAHPVQMGFSFGSGNFFDTGVGAWLGTITLHVTSYTLQ